MWRERNRGFGEVRERERVRERREREERERREREIKKEISALTFTNTIQHLFSFCTKYANTFHL